MIETRRAETAPGLMFRLPVWPTPRWGYCCTGSAYSAISGTTSCRPWRKPAIARWRQTGAAIRSVPGPIRKTSTITVAAHLSVIGNPSAMEAALAWYRARGERQPVGATKVPTLFIWGDAADPIGRAAAECTGEFTAAGYLFAALTGVGHYAADQVPQQITALLLDHLGRHPV